MSSYRILALTEALGAQVRATGVSPFAEHPTHADFARGYGPCRVCLRTFTVGVDRRILLTLDPFDGLEPFPLPGPVFIHERPCTRYPEDGGFPEDMRQHALTLNAYGRGRWLRAQERIAGGNAEPTIAALLAQSDVDYIHVRDTDAGCYDFRIERR